MHTTQPSENTGLLITTKGGQTIQAMPPAGTPAAAVAARVQGTMTSSTTATTNQSTEDTLCGLIECCCRIICCLPSPKWFR